MDIVRHAWSIEADLVIGCEPWGMPEWVGSFKSSACLLLFLKAKRHSAAAAASVEEETRGETSRGKFEATARRTQTTHWRTAYEESGLCACYYVTNYLKIFPSTVFDC